MVDLPVRIKFTHRDDLIFNQSVYIKTTYNNSNPALHIVDEASRFNTEKWLQNISAKYI